MASLTQCTWVWANSRRYWRTGNLACCSPWGSQFIRHNWVTEQQTNERMNATVFYKKTLWQQGGHSWLTLRWKILCHKKPASPLALFQGEDGSISPEFASLNPETHMEFFFSVESNEYDPETCQPDVAEMFIFLPISPFFFCPCVNTRFYFILLIFHSVLLEVNSHTENLSLVLMVEIGRPKLPWAKAAMSQSWTKLPREI